MKVVRTPAFLMANLGSEVSRLLDWQEKGDSEMAHKSLLRAEKILRDIEQFPEMQSRKSEMNVLNDVLHDLFQKTRQYAVSSQELKAYFLPFSLAVVRHLTQ